MLTRRVRVATPAAHQEHDRHVPNRLRKRTGVCARARERKREMREGREGRGEGGGERERERRDKREKETE